jgi:hypothetical protein
MLSLTFHLPIFYVLGDTVLGSAGARFTCNPFCGATILSGLSLCEVLIPEATMTMPMRLIHTPPV